MYVAELDLDALTARAIHGAADGRSRCRAIPSIVRDISIVVDDTLPAETVRGTIRAAAPEHARRRCASSIAIRARACPDGRVSLSLRLTFRSPERTLTDAEVQTAIDSDPARALMHRQHERGHNVRRRSRMSRDCSSPQPSISNRSIGSKRK